VAASKQGDVFSFQNLLCECNNPEEAHKFRPSQTYVESRGEATGANSGVIANKEAEEGAAEELAGSGGCL